MSIDEESLIAVKLLKTFHVNADERSKLEHPFPVSKCIRAIITILQEDGWYPVKWRPEDLFSGILLEYVSEDSIRLYRKEEVSFGVYQILETRTFSRPKKAILLCLKRIFNSDIDGIDLNYKK